MNYKSIIKNDLYRLMTKSALFIAILLLSDLGLSIVLKSITGSYYNGENRYRAAIEAKSEVIIFGASKAMTDYVPSIIEKNTGLSVYNLGSTGGTLLVQYPQLKAILKAYRPKIIVFELIGYDLSEGLLTYREGRTVERLLIHSHDPNVVNILLAIDKWFRFKLLLNSYRYSSLINDYIVELIRQTPPRDPLKGHTPKMYNKRIMDEFHSNKTKEQRDESNTPNPKRSIVISHCLDEIIAMLKENNIEAIFIKSPIYNLDDFENKPEIQSIDPYIVKLIDKSGFQLRNHLYYKDFYSNMKYFSDGTHMSSEGAAVYSKHISTLIDSLKD